MLIPSWLREVAAAYASLSRRVNANSQPSRTTVLKFVKLIKKGEC